MCRALSWRIARSVVSYCFCTLYMHPESTRSRKSGFMLLGRQSLIIVNVAIHCKRSPPLGYRAHVFSPSLQKDSRMLCSSIPRRLSLTLAKISEAKWSVNNLRSVIERCGTQLRAAASQVFIDLICPVISARTPRSLSAVSSPCCSAYASAWRVLRHTHTHVLLLWS